jgi:hypothetical protein
MKKLQQLFTSIVLTLVLSASAFAGDGVIWPWVIPPAPTSAPVMATNDAAVNEGIIHTGRATSTDSVTEVVLSLLPSVLALF